MRGGIGGCTTAIVGLFNTGAAAITDEDVLVFAANFCFFT
jgi:hypothetical protein